MMFRKPICGRWRLGLGVASLCILATLYTLISWRQHRINPADKTIPTWSQILNGLVMVTTENDEGTVWLWEDGKATFVRLCVGLVVGVSSSIVIGVAMGCYAPVEALFLPPLSVLAKIPPTSMLAVFFVLVGTGFEMYLAMIVFGVLPTMTQAVYQSAAKDVPVALVEKSLTLGATPIKLIWHVVYKQILPRILDAARLQIGPAMVFLVAAEWMLGDVGFGVRLKLQSFKTNMNVVYIYLAILGVAGFALDSLLIWLRRRICPWFGQ
jgi:NitT/TauT family transport system permease protein